MALLKYTGYRNYDIAGIAVGKLYHMEGYFLWQLAEDLHWYITENIGPVYKWGSNALTKRFWKAGQSGFWTVSDGDSWYLWQPNTTYTGWYLTKILRHGDWEWWDNDNTQYKGSEFYTRQSYSLLHPEGIYNRRGALRGSVYGSYAGTITITREINGWKSPNPDSFLGEYTAVGAETGTKTIGWKVLSGDGGMGDLTQKNNLLNGEYIFEGNKIVWFDGADWILSSGKGSKPSSGY